MMTLAKHDPNPPHVSPVFCYKVGGHFRVDTSEAEAGFTYFTSGDLGLLRAPAALR